MLGVGITLGLILGLILLFIEIAYMMQYWSCSPAGGRGIGSAMPRNE